MNLNKLFKAQAQLNEKIITVKGLQGQDLLDKKILALQVELGELANEWRGFKFWSEDQEPNDFTANPDDICEVCKGQPVFYDDNKEKIIGFCENCDGVGVHFHNPLLEEYVDCLHFILSIGNDIGIKEYKKPLYPNEENITDCFLEIFDSVSSFDVRQTESDYNYIVLKFTELGDLLGFTQNQIEQTYYEKNKINHQRQESGY